MNEPLAVGSKAPPFTAQASDGKTYSLAEVLKQHLSKIGVRVSLKGMETSAYYNKTYAYDYTLSHHVPLNQPDPDENLSSYFGRASTFYKWGNKEIHALIERGDGPPDLKLP